MNLFEYITTNIATQDEKESLTSSLQLFLNRIFTKSFAEELFTYYKKMNIEEKNRKDDVIAMTYPSRIVLNTHAFYALPKEEQLAFLAHELIHVAANKGNTSVKNLDKNLWKFYNKYKKFGVDVSLPMVGKANVSSKWINKNEALNYLVTEPIRWQYMKPESREILLDILSKSKLLNLSDSFWKKRI